jgi:hypothetical protein
MIEYVGSGGVVVGGCAKTAILAEYYITQFVVGDLAYEKYKAIKGFLSEVAIKRVDVLKNERTFMQPLVRYRDTLNGTYFEGDLVDYQTALSLQQEFLAIQMAYERAWGTCPK